ncbi:MAG: UpxY family transcription antiterminator [Candidatus Cryptobacteroides sp.]
MPEEKKIWFAMRVTYRRELAAEAILNDLGIENYIPKKHCTDPKNKGRKILVPAIHNLIFVYMTPSGMRQLKESMRIPYLQYMMDKRAGEKIIVPDSQMRPFIAATADYDETLLYFQPEELNLAKGTRVRVTAGPMEGHEGIFLKVKGARDRRLVILVEGVVAVDRHLVHPELVQVIG